MLEGPGAKPTTALSETERQGQNSLGHFCLPSRSSVYFTPIMDHDWYIDMWKHYSVPNMVPALVGQEANYIDKNTNIAGVANVDYNSPQLVNIDTSRHVLIVPFITVIGSALIAAVIALVVTRLSSGKQVHVYLQCYKHNHMCM